MFTCRAELKLRIHTGIIQCTVQSAQRSKSQGVLVAAGREGGLFWQLAGNEAGQLVPEQPPHIIMQLTTWETAALDGP